MCHQEREAGGAGLCIDPCKDLQCADTVFVYAGINYILLLPVSSLCRYEQHTRLTPLTLPCGGR